MTEIAKHWLSRPGFVRHYAVRQPDGDLYRIQQQSSPVSTPEYAAHYYSTPSFMRDMLGLTEPQPLPRPVTVVFDTRQGAEQCLAQLRQQAARMGISNYGGCIVERLCTPFSSGDAAVEFATEITAWLAEQGGGV